MRHILIATHAKMAEGVKNTLEFIVGERKEITIINAYIDDIKLSSQIDAYLINIQESDELIILTDILAGSVNQEMSLLQERAHTHIITGINLPLVLGIAMTNDEKFLTQNDIEKIIMDAKESIIYVNNYVPEMDDDDE
ncbi:PTS sugar transporter subunit IIA [Dellaglioa carnosa]|uniref:PTS sugar transporter subunit IIA n=1 Tax=Dellaglioa carnosa TaxID=2995136 RepID=UPI0022A81F76|nr:PTS N-acetylglucosamine transporter subunit IIBC [Dellaglioa carnosa]MCZ2492346.1 PTS N-acetylglucosamine transporter subunit IIBC [Dellaglioa carnosa]